MIVSSAMDLSLRARRAQPGLLDGATRLEEFAYRYGRYYDSYLAIEPGRECFWSEDMTGVVTYARSGRYLQISGGLLAADEHKEALLGELVDYASKQHLVLSFYNIADEELPYFRKFGFQVTKWGEEAIVDLESCTWQGNAFQWLRRQTNYCLRKHLVLSECKRELLSEDEWERVAAELALVSAAPLETKPQAEEMKFLEGTFDPENLGRKRVFIARDRQGAGRIEGFLVCNPCSDGRRWAFETYRHRPDAVRGTVSFLKHKAMQILQGEGIQSVSLCLVPGLRCHQPLPGDSALARRGMVLGSKYFNFIFDTAGLYHFKSRFRPRFENRYICALPRVSLGSAWAFVHVLGVLNLDFGKLCRIVAERLRKLTTRATLSAADE
jgi:phosphatidylglycerol lysyltransferase